MNCFSCGEKITFGQDVEVRVVGYWLAHGHGGKFYQDSRQTAHINCNQGEVKYASRGRNAGTVREAASG